MDDLSEDELTRVWNDNLNVQQGFIHRMAAEIIRRREADGWRPISEAPKPYRRIIAPYSDGGFARLLWVSPDGGFIDDHGDEVETLFDFVTWSYLPDGSQLWCETTADPITFPEPAQ